MNKDIFPNRPFGPGVDIYMFGQSNNWSPKYNPGILPTIAELSASLDIQKVFMPEADFSARICQENDLTGRQVFLGREGKGLELRQRCASDGIVLTSPDHAYALASGDCYTVILFDPRSGLVVAAHAGLRSVIDVDHILGGKPREYRSVVYAMLAWFPRERRPYLKAYIACGVAGKHFVRSLDPSVDRVKARENELIRHHLSFADCAGCIINQGPLAYGISLKLLIRLDLIRAGLDADNIGTDCIDTSDDCVNDERTWSSYERGDHEKRNLVLVVRRQ